MRVLLLGGTGNLGRRCIPALVAHGHTVTIYVRNPTKLRSLISAELLDRVTIVVGDATDSAGLKHALLEHDIEGVVDVAGNQVWPWLPYVLPQIAQAVAEAAIHTYEQRGGSPIRIWVTSGIFIVNCPGSPNRMILDFFPKIIGAQHDATRAAIDSIPTTSLRWSLLAITWMRPQNPAQGLFMPLAAPTSHNLLVGADELPDWQPTWISRIPIIGWHLNMLITMSIIHTTIYEEVADFLAADLESGSSEFVGKKVALKEKKKEKSV